MASEIESEKRETLADIVRDIRNRADCAERHGDRETHNDGVATLLRSIADRIEAIDSADAWRSLYTPGNAAAMREALENIAGYAETARCHTEDAHVLGYLEQIEKWAEVALSAPARECDVGIAEEQAERFGKFCGKYYNEEGPCNEECPLASLPIIHGFPRCQAYWAQTPYAAQEGAGK